MNKAKSLMSRKDGREIFIVGILQMLCAVQGQDDSQQNQTKERKRKFKQFSSYIK